jgi:uncharacterized protein
MANPWEGFRVLDAHTHLSGTESGESPEKVLACMDACGIEKAFVIAPMLNQRSWELDVQDLEPTRVHNDYCAAVCSHDPERLIGFCVLNPSPALADGSLAGAVDLMIEEAERCYRELGLRAVKMVPAGWYPNAHELGPLYRRIAELGMYLLFHVGVFLDSRESTFTRPSYYEGVRQAPGLRVQLAHFGWPWLTECIAIMNAEHKFHGSSPDDWQMRADVSFGAAADWQSDLWQWALDTLPPEMTIYGSDVFWPAEPDEYVEQYLRPQLGLFEVAATRSHLAPPGTDQRRHWRRKIFHDNAWDHFQNAVREPQRPRAAERELTTPEAMRGHGQGQ